ncbi:hypothetical protein [Azospirillum argentinense]|uniref:hypothetical protein n=1 Tax=Azospirillum argentinense TaxID=2970906 RepID=UPI0032DFF334
MARSPKSEKVTARLQARPDLVRKVLKVMAHWERGDETRETRVFRSNRQKMLDIDRAARPNKRYATKVAGDDGLTDGQRTYVRSVLCEQHHEGHVLRAIEMIDAQERAEERGALGPLDDLFRRGGAAEEPDDEPVATAVASPESATHERPANWGLF